MLLLCLFSGFIAAFALRKLQKHGKQGNFHVFGKKLHKKQADFLCVLTVELSRAAHIHYIYKNVPRVPLATSSVTIKKTNRFPLCYYYIASMRFCQAFQESFNFPNMTDCTNAKCSIRLECSKCSRQPSRQVFPPSSLYSSARKLTIGAYIAPAKS